MLGHIAMGRNHRFFALEDQAVQLAETAEMIAKELHDAPAGTSREPGSFGSWSGNWAVRFLVGSGERRARLRTLTLIRWVAIVGQAFTILLVDLSFEFDLPLLPLLLAVALSALINLYLELGFSASTRLTERTSALLLGYDLLQLTFLLALTGGLQNPFAVLLIIPITLSATILSLGTTVILCVMVTSLRHASWPSADQPSLGERRPHPAAAVHRRGVGRPGAEQRTDRRLCLAGRRRGTAAVGGTVRHPDGARPGTADVGARRARRGRRPRTRQPARHHRGDRQGTRQQHPCRQPDGRGYRRVGQSERALPRHPGILEQGQERRRPCRVHQPCPSAAC